MLVTLQLGLPDQLATQHDCTYERSTTELHVVSQPATNCVELGRHGLALHCTHSQPFFNR